MDWIRNLRIVLKVERIAYVFDVPLSKSPDVNASDEYQKEYHKHLDDNVIASCINVIGALETI